MFGFSKDGQRPSLLVSTLKAAAVVGVLSYGAANWLSTGLDHGRLARFASATLNGDADPQTTGSIGSTGNGVRLDPCAVPRRP